MPLPANQITERDPAGGEPIGLKGCHHARELRPIRNHCGLISPDHVPLLNYCGCYSRVLIRPIPFMVMCMRWPPTLSVSYKV